MTARGNVLPPTRNVPFDGAQDRPDYPRLNTVGLPRAGVSAVSKCLRQSRILQDAIRRVSNPDAAVEHEMTVRGRTVPNFVIAFSVAYERAAGVPEKTLYLSAVSASHRVSTR